MSDPEKLRAALQALQKLNIPFRGPFVTPQRNRVFVIGFTHCILTEQEIVSFYEAGKFQTETSANLLHGLEQYQRATHKREVISSYPPFRTGQTD